MSHGSAGWGFPTGISLAGILLRFRLPVGQVLDIMDRFQLLPAASDSAVQRKPRRVAFRKPTGHARTPLAFCNTRAPQLPLRFELEQRK